MPTPWRRLIRSRLLALPGVHRHQVGDGEAVVSLAAGDTAAIRAVAALLRLRQRRQLTPAQRQAAAERLAKPRATFRPKTA